MKAGKAIWILAIFMCSALSACGKTPSEEAKSLAYYKEHATEADTVAAKCKNMQDNEVSRMTPAQRLEWAGTPQGINCKNASKARSENQYDQYQERMRQQADKYR